MILGQFCKGIFFSHSKQLYTVTRVGYNLNKIARMFGWGREGNGGEEPAKEKKILDFLELFLN